MLSSLKCNFQGVRETKEEILRELAIMIRNRIFKQHRSTREKERAIIAAKEAGRKRAMLPTLCFIIPTKFL